MHCVFPVLHTLAHILTDQTCSFAGTLSCCSFANPRAFVPQRSLFSRTRDFQKKCRLFEPNESACAPRLFLANMWENDRILETLLYADCFQLSHILGYWCSPYDAFNVLTKWPLYCVVISFRKFAFVTSQIKYIGALSISAVQCWTSHGFTRALSLIVQS